MAQEILKRSVTEPEPVPQPGVKYVDPSVKPGGGKSDCAC